MSLLIQLLSVTILFYGLTNINAYLKECVTGTVVRDNIFMSDSAMAIKVYGSSTTVEYNCFYNNSTNIEYVGDPQLEFPTGNIYTDPMFENAVEGNFALASNSLCVGTAHNGSNMGDPRWGTYNTIPNITGKRYEIAESSDWISEIDTNISNGDTLMFITDGGNYFTTEDGVLPAVELVLMAKPGLENKPVLSLVVQARC